MRLPRMSPALVVALIAVFIGLGGTAVAAFVLGKNSVRSKNIAPNQVRASDLAVVKVRLGSLSALDPVAGDGLFTEVEGQARCRAGEQLLSGGVHFLASPNLNQPVRASILDSSPDLRSRAWRVRISSDLGAETRKRFRVYAVCLVR